MLIVIRYQCNQSIFLGFIVILDIMLQVNVQMHLILAQKNTLPQNDRRIIIAYKYHSILMSLHFANISLK